MSADFYADMAALALEMISEFGRGDILWTKAADATYNPATGGASAAAPSVATVKGLTLEYKNSAFAGLSRDGQGLVQRGDRRLLLAASGMAAAPDMDDTFTVSGKVWSAIQVKTLDPGGIPLVYEVQVRA